MRLRRRQAALLLAAVMAAGRAEAASDLLASAPIDATMFRDGEVRRSQDTYGTWTLVCDALPRLQHRFCSLSAAPAAMGSANMTLTVSTGDDGRPAALLRLPFGLSLPFGIRIKPLGPDQGVSERRIGVALCSASGCEAVWTLSASDVAALHGGFGLRIAVQGWQFARPGQHRPPLAPTSAVIAGRGFAEAVAASLR